MLKDVVILEEGAEGRKMPAVVVVAILFFALLHLSTVAVDSFTNDLLFTHFD